MDTRPRTRAICDASGFKCYADELVRQWDGAMVLPQFCDKRNPQDFVTGVPDNRVPRITRPEAPDRFLSDNLMDANGGATLSGANGVPLEGDNQ